MRIVLMYSLSPPSMPHVERLRGLAPGLEVIAVDTEIQAIEASQQAEVILGHRFLRQCLPHAKNLRWIQTSAQGVDRLPLVDIAQRGVILSRSTLDAQTVAAHAVAMAWSITRALPSALVRQVSATWCQQLPFAPLPRRAVVLGMGAIGRAIASRLRAQDIEVTCARRRDHPGEKSDCANVVTDQAWRVALNDADWCFLALPNTPETSGLFNKAAIAALPPHAVLVNVGRGETLDTQALLEALQGGHLAGAGLDVVEHEPLPANHPLWRAPRLFITPHIASHHPARNAGVERFFEQQVARYVSGEQLLDVIDLAKYHRRPGNQ